MDPATTRHNLSATACIHKSQGRTSLTESSYQAPLRAGHKGPCGYTHNALREYKSHSRRKAQSLPSLVDHDKGEVTSSLALATGGTDHTSNLTGVVRAPWGESSVTELLLLGLGVC